MNKHLQNFCFSATEGALENKGLRYIFSALLLFCSSALMAQISNQQFHFSCPGGVTITYDLACDATDVTLWYSADMSSWAKAMTVDGDVGTVPAGSGKTILWDNAADHVKNGNYYFKIKTSTGGCACMSNTFSTTSHTPTASQQVAVPITVSTTKDAAGNWVHDQTNGVSPTTTTTITFLTYNLGANPNLSPKEQMKQGYAASQDIRVYGGFYQWGRKDAEHTLRCNMADAPTYFKQAPTNADRYLVASYNPATDTKFVWSSTLQNGWWANDEQNNSNLWGNGCGLGNGCPTPGAAAGTNACPTTNPTTCFGGNKNVSKRPNDPCPVGYRVPTQHEWALLGWEGGNSTANTNDQNASITNDITVSKSGLVWVRVVNGLINSSWAANNMCGYALYTQAEWNSGKPTSDLTASDAPNPLLFLPAAGYRHHIDGYVKYVGTIGHYWSTTVSGTFSYYLNFMSSYMKVSDSNHRANGFSVRCVAE